MFTRGASNYQEEARVQREVANELYIQISQGRVPHRILELGCGCGFLTEHLFHKYPEATIDAYDISSSMLEMGKNGISHNGRISWYKADLRECLFFNEYDLVTSSSSLHWIHSLPDLFSRIHSALSKEGEFLFSVMLEGTLGELQEVRKRVAPENSPRGTLPSADLINHTLEDANFELLSFQKCSYEECYSSARAFLNHIHTIGVTGGANLRGKKPLSRQEIENLLVTYQESYQRHGNQVYATYEVGYFRAQRGR